MGRNRRYGSDQINLVLAESLSHSKPMSLGERQVGLGAKDVAEPTEVVAVVLIATLRQTQLGGSGMASTEDKLVNQAREHLDADEEVTMSLLGAYETKMMGQDTVRNGVLLATNKRVVFYAKKFAGYDLESFQYKNISSFETGKSFMGGTITFFASSNRVVVKWINPPQRVPEFVALVRERMHGEAAGPATAAAPVDVVQKIKQLSELHSAGILTDDEFSSKKAELLSQM